ncbi:MAG TPA: methylated-DNA--[protein]-cysteine S-methyltransferase [Chloroflexota bacterium]|nr:methylated-DNA--[protein]-cysteine S-methyltransferase [Chloroflexota bacterium]
MTLPGREPGWLDRWLATTIPGARLVEGQDADPHVADIKEQLSGYFAGCRQRFDVPLDLRGTPFQQAVWRAVADIPFGATRPFTAIAAAVGQTAKAGAVGSATHASPLPILVPSHRVVDQAGRVRGNGGPVSTQRWLLSLEGLLPEDDELPVRWYRRVQVKRSGPIYIGTPHHRTYCLPACINVQQQTVWVPRLFHSIQEARDAGFRSCTTCRPDHVVRRGPFPL